MANILSIQSTVLNDLVGNQAARSILQPRKHNLIEVPTIILTSHKGCLLYTSPSPRDATLSRMPSSA